MEVLLGNKLLTPTDIKHRLAYPTQKLDAIPIPLGQNVVGFAVRDATGRVWNFELSVRARGRHPKPVIIGDWLLFVREKGLVVGDRIFLTNEEDGQNGMCLLMFLAISLKAELVLYTTGRFEEAQSSVIINMMHARWGLDSATGGQIIKPWRGRDKSWSMIRIFFTSKERDVRVAILKV
ncbi:unnamed protein product [Dovyalis caffra]|uniref:TF-B3 domain-containing protein n=1 Tax=Dovyalis caffra TaxID=77055 RepID=A0AAV1QUA2_9ROSI|nr:unnamed protein product [Dovyalis caffra]